MANRERGESTLIAGKRAFTCRLGTHACAEVEDFSKGRTWQQIWLGMKDGSVKDVELFFWVALREHHPDIASNDRGCLKAVADVIDDAGGLRSDRLSGWIKDFIELNQDQSPEKGQEGGKQAVADPPTAQADSGAVSIETRAS